MVYTNRKPKIKAGKLRTALLYSRSRVYLVSDCNGSVKFIVGMCLNDSERRPFVSLYY